jgi:hypothetical protein
MSNGGDDSELGYHTFLPWLRRGIGIDIGRTDDDPTPAPRATLDIGVSIGPGPLSNAPTDISLSLYGPGDVATLDPRTVIRTWPRPSVYQAEPNYFPLIELQPADVPWRFTPARRSAADRLRPWLALIVLADGEYVAAAGSITVASAATLPLLDQSWAWAHVQISGEQSVDQATVLDLLDNEPERILARLVCPRQLAPDTPYTGFLVPALERARLAGLSQTVPDAIDGLAPAWTTGETNVQLPVYYQWRFETGDDGDFASLVERVQPRPMPATVGSRAMDVSNAGYTLPDAAPTALNVEAALHALDFASTNWAAADRTTWTNALETLLDKPADLLAAPGAERVVAPPLYGQWYAAVNRLGATPDPTRWFPDLNADPRLRVAAGLGTLVIQQNQAQYLAGAWAQVGTIRSINAALRAAQLARETAVSLYQRHLTVLSNPTLVTVTAPVQSRILASPTTVAAVLANSPLRAGMLRPAWRRLMRPTGQLGRRITKVGRLAGPTLVERVNAGTLRVAPPPAVPPQLTTLATATRNVVPSWATPGVLALLNSLGHLSLLELIIALLIAVILFLIGGGAIAIVLAILVVALQLLGSNLLSSQPVADLNRRVALNNGTLTASQIEAAPARPGFVPKEYGGALPTPAPVAAIGAADSPSGAKFRAAAAAMFTDFQAAPAAGPVLQTVDLASIRSTIVTALDPKLTVAASYRQRLTLAPGLVWQPLDPIEPIMAAPSFPDPMYKPLYGISQDWLLPGLDQVPADTISLVQTNERFIEAYMVGVNHEMTRTLLFNEYPIDQRGTYFRQFWDSSTAIPPGQPEPENLKDITPINTWTAPSLLGTHSSRPMPPGGSYLVLLLRAELLRRYPNTIVYASHAKWNADGYTRSVDDTQQSRPTFQGTLGAGVGFWGFPLTVADVRGGGKPPLDPGWFFILQEPPTEPRLGLEPVKASYGTPVGSWPAIAWSDLASSAAALAGLSFIDLSTALPNTGSVSDANHAAWHVGDGARASDLAYITYRVPMRVAVHGSTMIPTDVAP